ncbi:MAG: DUF624 domain-containing protein [Clostridia bacterium]
MAGFFGLFDFTKEGKGVSKNERKKYRFFTFFEVYFRKFWKLMQLNFLFSTSFLIPLSVIYVVNLVMTNKQTPVYFFIILGIVIVSIIPIGSALTGLFYVSRNLAREEHSFIWTDFIKAVKGNWKTGSLILFLDVIFAGAIYVGFTTYSAMEGILGTLGVAVITFVAVTITFMNYYMFTMQVTFKLTFKQLCKNGFLFAYLGMFKNILITILLAAIIFAVYILRPFSTIFVLSVVISLCAFIISFITYPTIKKFMIDPLYNKEEETQDTPQIEEEKEIKPAFSDERKIK